MNCQCNVCSPQSQSTIIYKRPFVEVHAHSSYSLLDGTSKFKDYVKKLKELGHPGMALTDHGSACGTFQFYKELKSNGLKPIVGCEFYTVLDKELRVPQAKREVEYKDCHQSVYIQNTEGYINYNHLHYLANTEGYYYKPRVTFEELFHYNKGLIVTTGCMVNIVNQLLAAGKQRECEEWFKKYLGVFGDRFYGEIQFNEIYDKAKFGVDQKETNNKIIELCNKYDVPVLIGGDIHYVEKGDDRLQDIVINVARGNDSGAESFIHARHLYFHDSEWIFKMNKEWGYNHCESFITECLDNSIALLDKINFEFDTKTDRYPKYQLTKTTSYEELKDLAEDGLYNRIVERKSRGEKFPKAKIQEYTERLNLELQVIKDKGYEDYFLIYQDLIKETLKAGYRVGPGRGSAAGSLLAYCTQICQVDPVKHGLYFERFLNPQRTAKPDIDSDFSVGGKEFVYNFLQEKYGKDCVIGVGTHSIYKGKVALKDAARGLGKDTGFQSVLMTHINKIPELDSFEGDLEEYFDNMQKTTSDIVVKDWIRDNKETIYYANKLMGATRQIGTHAGGIVVTPTPIWNHIPVTRAAQTVVTAYREADGSYKELSDLGLLKLDILGLSSLSIIQTAIDEIRTNTGKDISNDILYINLEDEKILKQIRDNNIYSIFQLDGGAQRLVKSIKPDCFEDICAISALNRPGPLETFGDKFGVWKRKYLAGKEDDLLTDPLYPKLDFMREVTKNTYGVLLYQEQFMFMVQKACDMDLGECDNFRRCIAWKEDHPKYYQLEEYFKRLGEGMLKKRYAEEDTKYFVDYCRKFLGYSFNRSHSLAYSYVSWQMLYLKTYYPAYYYAALFKYEDAARYTELINDMVKNDIKLLPPSIIDSEWDFKALDEKTVRMGFQVIKGFGDTAYQEIKALSKETKSNISKFFKVDFKKVNKRAFEALLNTGCFDDWGLERNVLFTLHQLYNDEKIEKWFTRKKDALSIKTLPESLKLFPEELLFSLVKKTKNDDWDALFNDNSNVTEDKTPWVTLVSNLAQYIKEKPLTKEEKDNEFYALTNFSILFLDKVKEVNEIYDKKKFARLNECKDENDYALWILTKVEEKVSSKGKRYQILEISDGENSISNISYFRDYNFKRNHLYVSNIEQNKFGVSITNSIYRYEDF